MKATKRQPPGISPPKKPAAGTTASSGGPMNLVTEAPTFPAPKTPRAKPWRSGGNQAEHQAMPMGKGFQEKQQNKGGHHNQRVDGKNNPPAVFIGHNTSPHPRQRSAQCGGCQEPAELHRRQPELLANRGPHTP